MKSCLIKDALHRVCFGVVFVLQNHLVAGVWGQYDRVVVSLFASFQANVAQLGAVAADGDECFSVFITKHLVVVGRRVDDMRMARYFAQGQRGAFDGADAGGQFCVSEGYVALNVQWCGCHGIDSIFVARKNGCNQCCIVQPTPCEN